MSHSSPSPISGSEMAAGIGVMFAATMLIVTGIMQVFLGLAAVANDEFFVTFPSYVLTFDVSTWGWVHLALAAVMLVAGFSLFSGSRVAGFVAAIIALISAMANFAFIPHHPIWATLIIAFDVFVIWAITRSGVLEDRPDTV